MNEFQNRVDTQRMILRIINSSTFSGERLFGLSEKAILRWAASNGLNKSSKFVEILIKLADRLFFLATKSQEQITEDYRLRSNDIKELMILLQGSIQKIERD